MGRLRAYWPLRSTTGTDQGPNAYNLTLTNTPGTPGKFGHALAVDGTSNSYMQFGTGFTLKSICSFSFWIKFDDFTGGNSNFHTLINKRDDAVGDGNGGWQVGYYNSSHGTYPDTFAFYFYYGSWKAKIFNPAGIKAGIWYHIAISADIGSSGNTRMWINGVPNGTPQSDTTSTWVENNANHYGKIGYSTRASASFKGAIQEVAIFDGSISDIEVKEYYDSTTLPLPTPKLIYTPNWWDLGPRNVKVVPPRLLGTSALATNGINSIYFAGDRSLVGSWPLNTGSPIETARGGGLNASYSGAVPLAPGAFGNGFRFPGGNSTDKITIPLTTNYDSEVTLIAWVRPRAVPSTGRVAIISKNSYYAQSATDFPIMVGHYPSGSIAMDLSKGDDYTADATVYLPQPAAGLTQSFNGFFPVVAVYKANTFAGLQVGDRYDEISINFTISTNSRSWTIGNDPFRQTGYGCFDGEISDVAILSRALSRAEIANYIRWAKEIKSRKGVHVRIFDIVPAGGGGGATTDATLSETLSLSDSLNRNVTIGRLLSETLAITDSLTYSSAISRALSDSFGSLTDTLDYEKYTLALIEESLSLTDSLGHQMTVARSLSDSLSLTDTLATTLNVSTTLSETLSLSDTLVGNVTLEATLTETLSLSDTLSHLATRSRTLSDNLALTDSFGPLNIAKSLSDSLSLTDTIATALNITATLTDTLVLSDSLICSGVQSLVTLQESLALSDTLYGWRSVDSTLSVNVLIPSSSVSRTLGVDSRWPITLISKSISINSEIASIIDVLFRDEALLTIDSDNIFTSTFTVYQRLEKTLPISSLLTRTFDITQGWNDYAARGEFVIREIKDFDPLPVNSLLLYLTPVDRSLVQTGAIWSDTLWNQGGTRNINFGSDGLEYQILLDTVGDVTQHVAECRVTYSVDQYCGEVDVTWKDWELFADLDCSNLDVNYKKERLTVRVIDHYNSDTVYTLGNFFLEKRGVTTSFGETTPTSWGRTRPARLAEPYADLVSKTWNSDTSAVLIAQELASLGDVALLWDIMDFPVRAGKFSMDAEFPIDGIKRLAEAVGGIVTTDRHEQHVRVRYKWQ